MKTEWEELQRIIDNAYNSGNNSDIIELFRLMNVIDSKKEELQLSNKEWTQEIG